MWLKKSDKKRERSLVFTMRKQLMSQLSSEMKSSAILHYSVLLIHAKLHTSVMLHAPSKSLSIIRRSLKSMIHPLQYKKLQRFNHLIQMAIRRENSDSSQQAYLSEDDDDEEMEQLEKLSAEEMEEELKQQANTIREMGLDPNIAISGSAK